MRSLYFCAVLALLVGTESHGEDANGAMSVAFDAATASIALRPSNRPIQLPSLTFAVRIEASCPTALEAKSVSISIADTRVNAQPDDAGVIEQSIRVPKKQLGPIAVNDFCIASDDADSAHELRVNDALSAQLSLHCSGDSRESMTYESVALEVALQCDIPEKE